MSAHEVKQRTGFSVEYGPVRAADLPDYLSSGATEEMRRVTFPLRDRAVLIPVELRNVAIEAVIAIVALFILGGLVPALIALMAVMAGAVLFPLLLPYLPTKDFTTKGMLLGIAASAPFAMYYLASEPGWTGLAYSAGTIMLMVSVVGFLALNFTGCTTYASRSGVRREIFRYVPALVIMAVVGVSVLAITIAIAALGWF